MTNRAFPCFEIFAEVPIAQKPLYNAVHFFHYDAFNANIVMKDLSIMEARLCDMKSETNR